MNEKRERLAELNERIPQIFEKVIGEATIAKLPEIIEALSQVNNEAERGIYVGKLAKKFGIKPSAIIKDIKNIFSTPQMSKKTSLTSLTPPTQIIEVVKTEQGLKYCMPDYEMKDSLEIGGVIYELPQQVNLVSLPTERFLQFGFEEDNNSLFGEVEKFIHEHLDLPQDYGYKVLTLWIMHTWLIDKFNASPIIHFLGPQASGKSRGGDVLSVLSKRGLATVNLTGAPIFRVSEFYRPAFIIDESKLSGRDRDRDILELLNARFQRGRKIIRINPDKAGLDSIQEFDVFGATVLCGLDELPETPRSRALVFIMEQNVRPVTRSLDLKRADILRDRLCAFRGRHCNERMPEVEGFVRDGRLSDAIEPLHQILKLVKPEIESAFIEFFKKVETERREDTFDSFDAEIVKALLQCKTKVNQGKILVSHITESFNDGKSESEKVSPRTIGKVLSRLGLKKTRTAGGIHARFWEDKRINRLTMKFGLNKDDVSDVSDVKNIILGNTENNLQEPIYKESTDTGKKKYKVLEIRDYGSERVEVIE